MNDTHYTTKFVFVESPALPVSSDDRLPERPASRPAIMPERANPVLRVVSSEARNICSADESLNRLQEFIEFSRFRMAQMTPAELEAFRSAAIPQLNELQKLLTNA